MPIEIKELEINAHIVDTDEVAEKLSDDEIQMIISESVERVLQTLKDNEEL